LISVGQVIAQRFQVRVTPNGCYVKDARDNYCLVVKGRQVGRMFTLEANIPKVKTAMFTRDTEAMNDIEIWHKRIGHLNKQRLKGMRRSGAITGLPKFKSDRMDKVCGACQFGKQTRNKFTHDRNVSRNILELIHSDVWGPTKLTSIRGCKYYVSFIDDYTRKVWVYFMKEKSEVFTHFQEFKIMPE